MPQLVSLIKLTINEVRPQKGVYAMIWVERP